MDIYYKNCKFYNENDRLLDNHALNVENGTRVLIKEYIKNDMKVLELGCRYGTVSVCLDYILDNPKNQLVCVDPDLRIKNCLNKNKEINKCSFNIFNGTISKKDLYVCYNNCIWESKTYEVPVNNLITEKIDTISIDDIQKLYNIYFDTLIADCEGFLLDFIKENDDFLNKLKCIIYEEDCTINHPINNTYINYNEVEEILTNKGFTLINSYKDNIGLYNKVWIK